MMSELGHDLYMYVLWIFAGTYLQVSIRMILCGFRWPLFNCQIMFLSTFLRMVYKATFTNFLEIWPRFHRELSLS